MELSGSNEETHERPSLQDCENRPRGVVPIANKKRKITGPTPSGQLKNFVDKTSKQDTEDLNKLFMKFMISGDLDFQILNNKYLKKFLGKLKPSYKLLEREKIIPTLQALITEKTSSLVLEADSFVTLLIGSFKKSVYQMLISFLQSSKGFDYVACASDQDINDFIMSSIEKVSNKLNQDWMVVISDVDCKIFDEMSPEARVSGTESCWIIPTHDLRLEKFREKIIAKKRELLRNITLLVSEFQTKREEFTFTMSLNSIENLNWDYMASLANHCQKNFSLMRQYAVDEDNYITQEAYNLIFDPEKNFKNELDRFCQFQKIFVEHRKKVLVIYQADSVDFWNNLYSQNHVDDFKDLIEEIIHTICENNFLLAANYLSPCYKNSNYSEAILAYVKTFITDYLIHNHCDQIASSLKAFIEYSEKKPESNYAKFLDIADVCKDPVLFWTMCRDNDRSLAELALKLTRLPASVIKIGDTKKDEFEIDEEKTQTISGLYFHYLLNES